MNVIIHWRKSLPLTLAILVSLALAAPRTATAHYVMDTDYDDYDSGSYSYGTSNWTETAETYALATDYGITRCSIQIYTMGKNGYAGAVDASANAYWTKTWEWDGAPGAAPGGTLSWNTVEDGYARVEGNTDPGDNGGAVAVSDAETYTCTASNGSSSYAYSELFGYVTDDDMATLDYSDGGSGVFFEIVWGGDADYGYYVFTSIWHAYDYDDDSIASGTSYVYFQGYSSCDCSSAAGAGPNGSGAEADSMGATINDAEHEADFDPN
ncbi:MAG: hypothetical protein JSU94_06125 [Phycisphaerales bacterium]|nr:MAG: hypothetical protein JSU94_06125 [Phycisphaerales bacterium]